MERIKLKVSKQKESEELLSHQRHFNNRTTTEF